MIPWNKPAPADVNRQDPENVFAAGTRNHHISNTAYPIAHNVTWKPYRVDRNAHTRLVESAFAHVDSISLYSHIPFCETRCYFCEYTVVGKKEIDAASDYMKLLSRELAMFRSLLGERSLSGFDIGGGTPSFVSAPLMAEHVDEVRKAFRTAPGFAISIETTPRIASTEPEKMKAYADMGIERISMGIQVVQPDLLKHLGRSENGLDHHRKACDHIRGAGFKKFNIDLMYGFAKQSDQSWEATLRHAIALEPDYITLYRMRYKLTRISAEAADVTLEPVLRQAKLASEMLRSAGYIANPGKNTYSRIPKDTGTSAYLTRRVIEGSTYLGLGLGAQTFTDTTISYNDGAASKSIAPYAKSIAEGRLPIQDLYHLPLEHMMAKMIAVSFYFGEIRADAFEKKFKVSLEEAFPREIEFALKEGLMHWSISENGQEIPELDRRALSLTPHGARNFNGTIALFFAPSVQSYLIHRQSQADMHRHAASAQLVADKNDAA